jgi:hypothetical protein
MTLLVIHLTEAANSIVLGIHRDLRIDTHFALNVFVAKC